MIKEKRNIDLKENKKTKIETERMDKSEDALRKMSHAYLGQTAHEYFGLPGKYKHNIENEFPDKDGKAKRTDGSYIVEDDGRDMIVNIEDESSIVNENTLAKSYRYSVNMQYAYKLPVYSAITTPIPLNKCTKFYYPSETLKYFPKIISFNEFDGEERLEYAKSKVNRNEAFSAVECYDLINIPKMFNENNAEILEEVCDLFSKIRIEDKTDKFKLANCLECVINKYAKTVEDINRLKGVINMVKVSEDTRQIVREVYKDEIEEASAKAAAKAAAKEKQKAEQKIAKEKQKAEQKIAKEKQKAEEKGKLELARKIAQKYGIEEIAKISGLKKEELLNTPYSK